MKIGLSRRFRGVILAGLVALAAVPAGLSTVPAYAAGCSGWMDTTLTPDQRTDLLLAAMTNADKTTLTQGQGVIWSHFGVAGYIAGNATLCIPDLVLNDAGQGVGDLMTGTTAFPAPIAQSATWDPTAQRTFGVELGSQAHQKGVNVQLAPGIEIDRVPMNGRNWEYMSEDPYLAGQAAAAVISGIQSSYVVATPKHYIANSQENTRQGGSMDVDERTLQELYLLPYEAAVQQGGAGAVMCSYNRINAVYACEHQTVLNQFLKQQLGFTGWVMSDWGATHSTALAANSGLDQEMGSATYFGSTLGAAVPAQVPQSRLDDMARRILRTMFRVGLFDHPIAMGQQAQSEAAATPTDTAAAQTLARQVAEQGAVLLKNQGGILPLPNTLGTIPPPRIAVIGDPAGPAGAELTYGGGGSGHIPEFGYTPVTNPLDAIEQQAATNGDVITYADGNGSQFSDAIAAATAANIAVVFAYDAKSEGTDQANLSLPPDGTSCSLFGCTAGPGYNQDALIQSVAAANPNTVVVLETGGPIKMPWINQVKAVVEAWYPGEQQGPAISNILFGVVNPSGKLPETFPVSEADIPTHTPAQYPGVTTAGMLHATYSEKLQVGYRWYDAQGIQPLFPFGHGLSYTTFAYSNLAVTPAPSPTGQATVSFDVTNTGTRPGAEVAQVYVGAPPDNYAGEPFKQLRGYQKISLAVNQTSHVSLPVNSRAVSFWDTNSHAWTVETGCHAVLVGSSSADIRLSGQGIDGALGLCTPVAAAVVPEAPSTSLLLGFGALALFGIGIGLRRRHAVQGGINRA